MSSGNEEGEETSSYSKNTNSGAESLSDDEVWQPSLVDDGGAHGAKGQKGNQGPPGDTCNKGEKGSQGKPGPEGPPGPQGGKGDHGDSGHVGVKGDEGKPGPSGVDGTPGVPGQDGAKGQPGKDGVDGDDGAPGVDGSEGKDGQKGDAGPEGEVGPPGFSGEKGNKGDPGSLGAKGDTGPSGEKGDRGVPGVGDPGPPGNRGVKGKDGFPGVKGQKGDSGDIGTPGATGDRGPTGPPGDTPPGVKGDTNIVQGVKGDNGERGDTGEKGRAGEAGVPGIGTPGQDGDKDSIKSTFYQSLRPRMLNLINEFADAEMFLIDGDSLFLELVLDNNLDWCYGGQFLHLIYLCEQYLHLFVRKGGVFQIVFFQDFLELWKAEPSLYLARLALKIHLCEHIDNKVLCEFKNPWDPKFAKYVEEFCPSFMLLSDDEIVGLSSRPFCLSKLVSKIFVCQLLECLHLGLNCAFTAGIEFGTSTLNGYHVASEGYFQIWKLSNDKILDDLRSYNLKFQTDIRPSPVDLLSRLSNVSSPFAVECSDNEGRLDCRLFLHMAAASVYLKSFSNDTHKAKSHHDLVRVVLLHGVLLTELPLKYRAFSLDNCDIIQEHTVRQNLLHCFTTIQFIMSEILESLLMSPEASVLSWSKADISDIWDGRLLFVLLSVLLINKSSGKGVSLTERSRKKFVSLTNSVSLLSDERIEPFPILDFLGGNLDVELEGMFTFPPNQERTDVGSNEEWQPTSPSLLERQAPPELEKEGLIKMECPLLNNYVGEIVDTPSVIKLDENDPGVAALVMSGNDFDETYHWHSGKPLPDEYERTKETKFEGKDKRATMRNQDKYVLHMRIYGESLEGEMNSKPIVVENAGRQMKSGKKDKASHSEKSQSIIEENIRKKTEETAMKDKRLWENEKRLLQRLVNEEKYDEAFGNVVNVLERVSADEIIIDGLMMKTMICWKKWQLVCDKKDADSSEAQNCFLVIRELLENYANDLKHKDEISLGKFLVGLGFSDIALKMNLIKSSLPSGEYSLNVSSSRFQLHNIGHQLRRETRTDPDSRVDNFIPETWQRKLLDAVDNKQSALIVAPTSSGKTFASYYCMERVLKEDNDGVVVYVSPTKALVNQVAATCYARYHKKIMPAGKSVCGVFTRDYRHNALNSQILVTVPQCLEILLLSPGRQDWAAKIKYVVFDEVHCLGSEIGAEYWEHLLLLIRSPFLALSATIRNPDDLHKWLQSAEYGKRERDVMNRTVRPNPKSYDVALVTYNERYNDLEKFDYVAPAPISGSKRGSLVDQQLKHIHPCAMLTVRQLVQAPTFPAHVSLSPRESLALYDAMIKAWPEKDTLQCLCPENYFKDVAFISKPNARSYEAALKTEFMTWIIDRMEKVIVHLGGNITSLSGPKARVTGKEFVVQEFYCLLQELDKSGKLPAIFFSYDRSLCEKLTSRTVNNLFEKEKSLQTGSSAHRKAKSQEKQARQVAKREKRSRDNVEEEAHNKQSCFLFDNPPNESCSFAGAGVMDAEDAKAIVRKLEWKKVRKDTPMSFKEGLRRGVSYHHSGMPAWQRQIVEMLFRKKFLRVIFATGTLALGIHMPCKTVVFAGDSVYLNTLQYHQISGRAGRRGFDLLGNVIFLGVPHAKIQRLMTVNLPRIIGNFPLNVTLVLRLLLLVNKVRNREAAMNQVLTLLQNPLICMDQPELDLQLKHHFLFSVQLLLRQGLLDRKGNPQGLAGLATHLHYHEPSNLVLVAFLKEGLLHEFCKRGQSKDGFSKDFLISLVTLLSHLFTRVRLHGYILRRKRSTSKVKLEDLSPTFKEGLTKYNNKLRKVFDLYLRTVAAHVYDTMGEDVTLPLSQTKFILSESDAAASVSSESGPTVEEKLQDLSLPYKACSAFAALSGNTDNRLYNSENLISNIRYQVYTDIKVVPVLQTDVTLNAYAVDFFNHGNDKALVSENGLMQGEVFSLLKDFLLVIKSIHVSLVDLAPEDGDAVIAAFAQLSKEYTELFDKAFKKK